MQQPKRNIPDHDPWTQAQPSRPIPLPVSADQIPLALRVLPQWVGWHYRYVIMRPQPWTKVPYNPNGSWFASTRKPRTWGTFDQAMAYYRRFKADGIGFMLTAENGLVGVDFDHCQDPDTGEIAPEAQALVAWLQSYAEVTPSATGVRVFLRATLPPGRWRNGPIELVGGRRFLPVTGWHVEGAPVVIEARQAALDTLQAELFGVRASHEGRKGVRGV
jgi:primase-polymerase (primpol)-like protein